MSKDDLITALRTLGAIRHKRGVSIMPVWLSFDSNKSMLAISEQRSAATAMLPASGSWPPAGATVDLFSLRNAASGTDQEAIMLAAIEDAILIPTSRGHVTLKLLPFGPASRRVRGQLF